MRSSNLIHQKIFERPIVMRTVEKFVAVVLWWTLSAAGLSKIGDQGVSVVVSVERGLVAKMSTKLSLAVRRC